MRDNLHIYQVNPFFIEANINVINTDTKEPLQMHTFPDRHTSYNKIFKVDYRVSQVEISPTFTHEGTFVIIPKDDYKKVVN